MLVDGLDIFESRYIGIALYGYLSEVRNCRILNVGLSTVVPYQAFGIVAAGGGNQIRGNFIEAVFAVDSSGPAGGNVAGGISVSRGGSPISTRVSDNFIYGVTSPTFSAGIACNSGGVINISGNDVLVSEYLIGRAWNTAGCQDLGGNAYIGLPPS